MPSTVLVPEVRWGSVTWGVGVGNKKGEQEVVFAHMGFIIQWKRPKHVIPIQHKKRNISLYIKYPGNTEERQPAHPREGGGQRERHKRDDHSLQLSKRSPQRLQLNRKALSDPGARGGTVLQRFFCKSFWREGWRMLLKILTCHLFLPVLLKAISEEYLGFLSHWSIS